MGSFCNRCGTELPLGARFCSSCGASMPPLSAIPARPLVRPLIGRRVAGVCAALAQAYGWDVALIRIFAVVAIFCTGPLIFAAYLAGWIGIPPEEYSAGI